MVAVSNATRTFEIQLRKEMAEVLTKPLSIIYQQSQITEDVPVDSKLANVIPIYKKGRNEDLGNYWPVIYLSSRKVIK